MIPMLPNVGTVKNIASICVFCITMIPLNLPKATLKLSRQEGNVFVFDIFRKKNIQLTPEEWVRQHFAHYLMDQLNYPRSLMKIEGGLKYNQRQKRSDILVYQSDGRPHILVECKTFQSKLNQQALNQIATYNKSIQADWLAVTNGLKHYYFSMNNQQGTFEQTESLPVYEAIPK